MGRNRILFENDLVVQIFFSLMLISHVHFDREGWVRLRSVSPLAICVFQSFLGSREFFSRTRREILGQVRIFVPEPQRVFFVQVALISRGPDLQHLWLESRVVGKGERL